MMYREMGATARLRAILESVQGIARVDGDHVSHRFPLRRVGVLGSGFIAPNKAAAEAIIDAISAEPWRFSCDGTGVEQVSRKPADLWQRMEACGEWSLAHPDWARSYEEAWPAIPQHAWAVVGSQDNVIWTVLLPLPSALEAPPSEGAS